MRASAQCITEIIDSTGDGAGNTLDNPRGIAVDGSGNVYVAGNGSSNAFKVTPGGVITQIIDSTGDNVSALGSPIGIDVDAAGNVYVAGTGSDNVFKVTPGGVITEIIDTTGDGTSPLDGAFGVAVDASGNVFVSGFVSDNVFEITPGGVITEIIDSTGDGTNALDNPRGVAVDGSGNVYVAAFDSSNAFKITPGGVITEIIDSTGDGSGNSLAAASDIAVDGSGNVYVSGFSNNAFKITTPSTCSTTGTPCAITEIIDTTGDGGGNPLNGPRGIAADASGNVYITGQSSENAFEITPGGAITEIIDSTAGGAGTFRFPADLSIAVDGSGNVYVTGDFGLTIDNAFKISVGGGSLVITCPADRTVECGSDTSPISTASAVDECTGASVAATFADSFAPGCGDSGVLTRTWTADSGTASAACDQIITVEDTTAPDVVCPPDALGLECPADTSATALGSATGSDDCGGVTTASDDATVAGCGGTEAITRTWTATDACGNTADCVQPIDTVDTVPPTISVDTSPIQVVDTDCSGDEVVTIPTASAEDDCDGSVSVTDDAPAAFPAGETTDVTYSAADGCGNEAEVSTEVSVAYGADISVKAKQFTISIGHHPSFSIDPLVGLEVCAFDKSPGSCAQTQCGGVFFWHYECIATTCESVNCCTTGSDGRCTINVPPGDYIGIAYDETGEELSHPLAFHAGDVDCGELQQEYLHQIVVVGGRRHPCKFRRLTGSELLIIEPEFILWDEPEQQYPFVFDTEDDWSVTASVTPPEGFESDYEELSAEVDNEVEAVQFTVTEVGSDLVPTETRFDVIHKGRRTTVRSNIDIRLTSQYARSRGFDVSRLKARGLIRDAEKPQRRTLSR